METRPENKLYKGVGQKAFTVNNAINDKICIEIILKKS
jgi:hypothetical protein